MTPPVRLALTLLLPVLAAGCAGLGPTLRPKEEAGLDLWRRFPQYPRPPSLPRC